MYTLKNFRPNLNRIQLHGSCQPHIGQIIADLYEGETFYRAAVVTDLGKTTKEAALAYCEKRNKLNG